jgi:hypothetical protein
MEDFQTTYWINRDQKIALVHLRETVVQEWQALGRNLGRDFKHCHTQTTFPSKERLQEHLRAFEPSSVEEFIEMQFDHHALDDYFRAKASDWKQRQFEAGIRI